MKYVENKGYGFDRLFIEEGDSAKTDDRPVLQEMLAYCKKTRGRIQVLIFPKIDRFARYTEDYHFLKGYLRKLGIRVESTDERFDDSPAGRYMENMLAATAQYDNDLRSERCRGGMKEASARGRWVCGKAPIGYRNTRFDGKATIEPDPETAPLIARTFSRLASGRITPQRVRGWLERKGIRLSRTRFYTLIRSKAYIGFIESFGLDVRAAAPFVPLVSEAVFYRAQAAVQVKDHPTTHERDNHSFPLRGTLRCPCGRYMTASWSRGRSKKYAYYRCKVCASTNYPRDEVETAFQRALKGLKGRYGLTPNLRDRVKEVWEGEREGAIRRKGVIEREINKIRGLQKAIVRKNAEGVVPDDVAKDQIKELGHELGRKQIELDDLNLGSEKISEILNFSETFLAHLDKHWRLSDLETKKHIQKFFYPNGATAVLGVSRTATNPPQTGSRGTVHPKVSAMVDHSDNSPNTKMRKLTEVISLLRRINVQFRPGSGDLSSSESCGSKRR